MVHAYVLKYSNAQRKAGSLEREIIFDSKKHILHLIFSSHDGKCNKLRRGKRVLERLQFSKIKSFSTASTGLKGSGWQYLPFGYIAQ